jgi:hypothetical protein
MDAMVVQDKLNYPVSGKFGVSKKYASMIGISQHQHQHFHLLLRLQFVRSSELLRRHPPLDPRTTVDCPDP